MPPKADAKALTLATQIIDSLAAEWDPERYHDTYTEELRELIKRKEAGKETTIEAPPPSSAKVIDLMAALEASVAASKGKRSPKAARKALSEAAAEAVEAADADAMDAGKGDNADGKQQGAAGKSARSQKRRPPKSPKARKAPAKRSSRRPRKSA